MSGIPTSWGVGGHGVGRRWGSAALVVVGVVVLLAIVSVVSGVVINPRQQSMLDRAADIEPPVGFAVSHEPIGIGWCGPFQFWCDEAEVLWSYAPAAELTDPIEMCAPYLQWAKEQGVDTVFLASDAEWQSWVDVEIVSQREKTGSQTYSVDSPAALDACVEMVAHPRSGDDGLDKAMNLIGAQHAQGSLAEVLVARITEPKSLPTGNPLDDSRWPFMIMGGLHSSD